MVACACGGFGGKARRDLLSRGQDVPGEASCCCPPPPDRLSTGMRCLRSSPLQSHVPGKEVRHGGLDPGPGPAASMGPRFHRSCLVRPAGGGACRGLHATAGMRLCRYKLFPGGAKSAGFEGRDKKRGGRERERGRRRGSFSAQHICLRVSPCCRSPLPSCDVASQPWRMAVCDSRSAICFVTAQSGGPAGLGWGGVGGWVGGAAAPSALGGRQAFLDCPCCLSQPSLHIAAPPHSGWEFLNRQITLLPEKQAECHL